jgi:hypothetical protein
VARGELPHAVGWSERMRQLDEALSIGLITSKDYRRRRAELLDEIDGGLSNRRDPDRDDDIDNEQGNEQG